MERAGDFLHSPELPVVAKLGLHLRFRDSSHWSPDKKKLDISDGPEGPQNRARYDDILDARLLFLFWVIIKAFDTDKGILDVFLPAMFLGGSVMENIQRREASHIIIQSRQMDMDRSVNTQDDRTPLKISA